MPLHQRRRILSKIDDDVKDAATHTAYKFYFFIWRQLVMQAPDGPAAFRIGMIALQPFFPVTDGLKFPLAIVPRKPAAFIRMNIRLDGVIPTQRCRRKNHRVKYWLI